MDSRLRWLFIAQKLDEVYSNRLWLPKTNDQYLDIGRIPLLQTGYSRFGHSLVRISGTSGWSLGHDLIVLGCDLESKSSCLTLGLRSGSWPGTQESVMLGFCNTPSSLGTIIYNMLLLAATDPMPCSITRI